MNKIPNIKSFSEHGASINEHIERVILNEGATDASKEMEYVLVDAAGGPKHKKVYNHVKPYAKKIFPKLNYPSVALGKLILKNAKGLKLGGTNRMSIKAPKLSKKWQGGNATPKTDIIINSKKVSLKRGNSRIMSGGTLESLSTFNAALDAVPAKYLGITELAKDIETGINSLLPSTLGTEMGGINTQKWGGTVYQKTKQKKGLLGTVKAGSFNKDKILKGADKLNKNLTKKFEQLFKASPDFKKEFVFEAMTGKVKFGGNEGTATHFLVCDFDGSASYHEVKKSSDPYVTTILRQVNPDVTFKSGAQKMTIDGIKDQKTGYYRFYSVVGLAYKAAVKSQNEVYDMMNSGELEYLSEGFFDFIKKAWNKFKGFVKNLIEKATKWVQQSARNMMEFFELQPKVKFNNNIRW
jgi:regulator of sigma D